MAELTRSTMDFFAAQAAAKRRTALLVVLFGLSCALTILLVDLGVTLVLSSQGARGTDSFLRLLLPVAGGVLLVVFLGTAWHRSRLSADSGDAIARMLGGVPVPPGTVDPAEKRALHVLEEMAIAAAVPVPRLYVLPEEPTINAFAAGTTPERAVVAVSRGALDELTRDELQGVLAHELSHVLNADTRLNVRLLTVVGGLTALTLLGRVLLEVFGRSRVRVRRGKGNAAGAIAAIGLVLLVAGAIGAFFGKLLRLAVSRQREFLADAAAVQFTRNPGGLSGALAKIARRGSALSSPAAAEAAHFFFAEGLSGLGAQLFATHPPLEERIRRLQSGPLAALRPLPATAEAPAPSPSADTGASAIASTSALAPSGAAPVDGASAAAAATAGIGRLVPDRLEHASAALAALPAALLEAAREPYGARALTVALLLDRGDPGVLDRQLAGLGDAVLSRDAARLAPAVAAVTDRLGLLDLALPALDRLSPGQARALVEALSGLAAADARITLFEWALQRIVRRRLAPQLGEVRRAVRARTLEQIQVEALELLSALAWLGHRDPAAAQRALDAATPLLAGRPGWRVLPRDRISPAGLDRALTRLDEASPPLKAQLVGAAAAAVLADGSVSATEAELLRAVSGSIGLPMPALPAVTSPGAASAA